MPLEKVIIKTDGNKEQIMNELEKVLELPNARLSLGDRWLTRNVDAEPPVWEVWEHKLYQKKTRNLYSGKSLDAATAALVGTTEED